MENLTKSGKSLKNFTYDNKEIAEVIHDAFSGLSFVGVSVSMTCLQLTKHARECLKAWRRFPRVLKSTQRMLM